MCASIMQFWPRPCGHFLLAVLYSFDMDRGEKCENFRLDPGAVRFSVSVRSAWVTWLGCKGEAGVEALRQWCMILKPIVVILLRMKGVD